MNLDTIESSITTINHFAFSLVGDKEVNINILFQMALQRLAFMPFGYLVDKYRWDLYSGKVSLDDMNCHWVKLRSEIQGILLKKSCGD